MNNKMVAQKQIIYIAGFVFLVVMIIMITRYSTFKKKGKKNYSILELIGFSIKEYPWITGEWENVCPSCGPENVSQTRTVTCSSSNPDDCYQNPQSIDNPLGKPSETRSCDTPKCHSDWIPPTFEDCPSCGPEETKILYARSEAKCPEGTICDGIKPKDTFVCGVDDNRPIPRCPDWVVGNWSDCPTCGPPDTRQTRSVECSSGNLSDCNSILPIPDSWRNCDIPVCPDWVVGDWNSSSCPPCGDTNGAQQTRTVSCPSGNDDDCSRKATRPYSSMPCPQIICDWKTGPWVDNQQDIYI